jgi:5-(carboxyamino)imidazole ribonucleotide synthase
MQKQTDITKTRLGVLGGGQLGKMMALAAGAWHLPYYALDQSADFPAAPYVTRFFEGNFKSYDDVYRFGKEVDVLTIEIEHVNTDALLQLEKEGLTIHPRPAALATINDKGAQKLFYREKQLPTAPFDLYENADAIRSAVADGSLKIPFVQKSRTAGYDGRGVFVVESEAQLADLLPGAGMVEPKVKIAKELAVIVARNESGQVRSFPAVEMAFNPQANLVEYLFCPAQVDPEIEERLEEIARQTIAAYDICGLLAVEFFLTVDGEVLINEVAPRTHNSGHHTIDSSYTSQFEQHIRAVLDLPLGSTRIKCPSVMVNLLGAPGFTGPAYYDGLPDCLAMEGVRVHIYGKTTTKPFRKMGHVTILDSDLEKAKEKARRVKERLRVITR